MALFESYERRINQITPVLEKYGINSIEECRELCKSKGFDPYQIVKDTQNIAFENACWAYTICKNSSLIAVFIASHTKSVFNASNIVLPGRISDAIAAECVIPEHPIVSTKAS